MADDRPNPNAMLADEAGLRRNWPVSESVLVCVGPSPLSATLVRAARRLALGFHAPLIAAYVETPSLHLSPADRQRVDQNLRLAEQLGAATVTLSGERVADEIIAYAASHHVTKVVVGKPLRSRWHDFVFGSVVDDLIRRSGQIDVYVIRSDEDEEFRAAASPPPYRSAAHHAKPTWDLRGYAWAATIVAIATAIGWPLYHGTFFRSGFHLAGENILLLYLLGIVWVATHYSRSAAILAALLAAAAFDLVFVGPHHTLASSDWQRSIVTCAMMLATALVVSAVVHRMREQAESSRQRERRTNALLALSRELAAARGIDQVVAATVRQAADVFGQRAIVMIPDADQHLAVRADSSGASTLDEKDRSAAEWVLHHDQLSGASATPMPAASATYVPLKGSHGNVGVLGVFRDPTANGWTPPQRQLLDAFATQAAVAIERAALAQDLRLSPRPVHDSANRSAAVDR